MPSARAREQPRCEDAEVRPLPCAPQGASARGHLSNEQSAGALEELASDRLEEVVALHVSENNNDYLLPEKSLEQTLALLSHPARVRVGFQHTPIRVP